MKGIVTDIQRTSVHDGPGLRTTVFLKGCNLRCQWCHNPETMNFKPEILYYPELCIHCGRCMKGDSVMCPTGAKVLCGKEYKAEEILDIVEEDKVYYRKNGGMTISGGEPSVQPEFLKEILREAKKRNINTGIETNLSMNFSVYKELLPYIDYWMIDIKIYDEEKHKKYTGSSNKQILSNIRQLDKYIKNNLIIRTPVIKGINNTEDELGKIAEFISVLNNLMYYELLPYHPLGMSKQVQENQYVRKFEIPDKQELKDLAVYLKQKYNIEMKLANVSV